MPQKKPCRDDYTVAWICPLEVEQIAAMEMLDEEHETLPQSPEDANVYNLGSINNHNVVVAGLPRTGNCSAATVIAHLKRTFTNVKYGLLVGIGGGVPVKTDHGMLRLGHVVVSEPTATHSGAVQWDHGKAISGEFERKGFLNSPPTVLLNAARQLSVRRQRIDHDPVWKHTQRINISRPHLRRFKFPGVENDHLYPADYEHREAGVSCEDCGCDPKQRMERLMDEFHETFVTVHRGTVASGELVIKDAKKRDDLARRYGVLCFEMEAAGTINDFPCMVIRGISDYCDSHKNDIWHGYAAAVAAAYARELFFHMPVEEVPNSFERTNRPFQLPFDLAEISAVPYFVTRQSELEKMHKLLSEPIGRRIAILYGLGGMGKTQLAISYMKGHSNEYPVAMWLNAKDKTTLKQSFARAAEKIQRLESPSAYVAAALESRDPNGIWKAVKRWLEEPMNSRWIFTYDNYDDPRFDDGLIRERPLQLDGTDLKRKLQGTEDGVGSKAFDIRPFLPTANHGSIIITSRSSAVNFAPSIKVGKLEDLDACLDILAQTSRRQNFREDPSAIELAQQLDGLPLAIATAGAYLDQVAMSCAEYLQLYHDSWLQLHQEAPRLPSYDQTLYSTWGISYNRIKEKSLVAALILRQWAYFSNEDLWYELLKEGVYHWAGWLRELTDTKLKYHGIMRILCDHGLVEADTATEKLESSGYSVHGCVHAWMIHVLNQEHDKEMALTALQCVASHVPKETQAKFWITEQRLIGHADRCMEIMLQMETDEKVAWACNPLGSLYWHQGRPQDSEILYRRALKWLERAFGHDHVLTLNTVCSLGGLYADHGLLEQAETMHRQALESFEKALGPSHLSTIDIANDLGAIYSKQGKIEEAEAMFKRALEGYEKMLGYEQSLGPSHTLTLKAVSNLGIFYSRHDKPHEAEAMYERALKGFEKTLGPNHISTSNIINSLGGLYFDQGRMHEAEAAFKRALEGYEKSLGPALAATHVGTLAALENLGKLHLRLDRFSDALFCFERTQSGVEAVSGRKNHDEAEFGARETGWRTYVYRDTTAGGG
ncbi:hypothetical protein PWT90_04352 [Aphanocladium album]|nr:hypothetical protein PWT90_04352 [Aphanocladium album]